MKTRQSLQEVEGDHLCCLTLREVCQILPRARRQGDISGLYKWSEDEYGMVDDVKEKEKNTALCFDGGSV